MTSFLHLNVQDYDFEHNIIEMNKVCICCTSQNTILLRFDSCKHTGFMTKYIKLEVSYSNEVLNISPSTYFLQFLVSLSVFTLYTFIGIKMTFWIGVVMSQYGGTICTFRNAHLFYFRSTSSTFTLAVVTGCVRIGE